MSKGKIFAVLMVLAFVLVLVPTLSMAVDRCENRCHVASLRQLGENG